MQTIFAQRNGFRVKLILESQVSDKELLTIKQAATIMADELGSREFEVWCKSFSYTYTQTTGYLWWKKSTKITRHDFKSYNDRAVGRTREEIYNIIMAGAETLNGEVDNEADIVLRIDRRNKRGVLGYTYANSVKQWIYSWFLKSTPRRVAGNLTHEWVHKLGFGHAFRYNSTRAYTVPYAVGDYVAGIVR